MAWTVYLSLTDAEGSVRAESEFVGLQQLPRRALRHRPVLAGGGRTAIFTGGALFFELVLGMAIALLLWRPVPR